MAANFIFYCQTYANKGINRKAVFPLLSRPLHFFREEIPIWQPY